MKCLFTCSHPPRVLLEVPDVAHEVLIEVGLVADHQNRAAVSLQGALQLSLGVNVKVIRRLVEEQQVGRAVDQLAEPDLGLLAA